MRYRRVTILLEVMTDAPLRELRKATAWGDGGLWVVARNKDGTINTNYEVEVLQSQANVIKQAKR